MNRRLRVLSLINELHYVGGGENRLFSFALTVDRSRIDHTVASFRSDDSDKHPYFPARLQAAGVSVRTFGIGPASAAGERRNIVRGTLNLSRKIKWLSHLIRELEIDLVDAHLDPAILVGVLSGLLTRVRKVVTVYEAQPFPPSTLRTLSRRITFRLADAIITDSQARSDDIRTVIGRTKRRIAVIPNGIPPPIPNLPSDQMRRMLNIPGGDETIVIGQVSRLVPFKGHSVLLDAARTVVDKHSNAFFLVIGYEADKGYKEKLVQQAAALGLSDRVRITGYAGPIGDVWQLIDLHVHASLFDSLPNAIIEGMSLHKPAVVTAVGGIPEAVEHDVTGLIVPPGNTEALSAALLKLLREPETAGKLGNAAYKRYEERYRAEIMSAKLQDFFEDVVSAKEESPYALPASG